MDRIRGNLRKGNFGELEVRLDYSRPILIFLQKAIRSYSIKKAELESVRIPSGKHYTLLKGKKAMSVIHKDTDSFNEEFLLERDIEETDKRIDFESAFKSELREFDKFNESQKKEELQMEYFNDKVDRLINSLLDQIISKKLKEAYPDISSLESSLESVRDKCVSTT